MNKDRIKDLVPLVGIVLVLVFSVLTYGGREVWKSSVICGILFTAAAFFVVTRREKLAGNIAESWAFVIPALLFLGVVLLQLAPLPPWLLAVLSPSTHGLYEEALGGAAWRTLSLNTTSTVWMLLLALVNLCIFFMILWCEPGSRTSKRGVQPLIAGIFWVIFGLALLNTALFFLQKFGGLDTLRGPFTGTFRSKNSFSQFLEMAVPLGMALIIAAHLRAKRRVAIRRGPIRSRISRLLPATTIMGFGVVLVICALLLSISRGGLITLPIAMGILLVFIVLSTRRGDRRSLIIYSLVLAASASYLLWLGIEPIVAGAVRLAEGDYVRRSITYGDALRIIRDFPLFGVGLYNWRDIIMAYDSVGRSHYMYAWAYNDALQAIAETGFLGFAGIAAFVAAVYAKGITALRRGIDPERGALIMGGLTAMSAALIHGQFDYLMYLPSNAIVFMVIAGAVCRLSKSRDTSHFLSGKSSVNIEG